MFDECKAVNLDYMQFSEAFDNVSSSKLIQRMHGVDSDLVARIQNWLDHGRRRAVVEGFHFIWRSVTLGVLQK